MGEIEPKPEFNLSNLLKKLEKSFTISRVPADETNFNKIKFWVLSLNQQPDLRFCVCNKIPALNQGFYNLDPDTRLLVTPMRIIKLNDDIISSLDNSNDDLISNLIKNGFVVGLIEGKTMFQSGESRPGLRNEKSDNSITGDKLAEFALTEDKIQEYYLAIIRYLWSTSTALKISNMGKNGKNENSSFTDLNNLIQNLQELVTPDSKIELQPNLKDELNEKIRYLEEAKISNDRNFLSKFKAFATQSLSQFKRIMLAADNGAKIEELLDRKIYISKVELLTFWFTKVFFPNITSFSNWQENEFNFFQGQYVSLLDSENDVKIVINYLEPYKILPELTSILRVAADGFKIYSLDTLSDSNLKIEIQNRNERLDVFLHEISKYPNINKKSLESSINFVFLMTMSDLIIDGTNELSKPQQWFSTANDVENYKKGTLACILVLKKLLKIGKI